MMLHNFSLVYHQCSSTLVYRLGSSRLSHLTKLVQPSDQNSHLLRLINTHSHFISHQACLSVEIVCLRSISYSVQQSLAIKTILKQSFFDSMPHWADVEPISANGGLTQIAFQIGPTSFLYWPPLEQHTMISLPEFQVAMGPGLHYFRKIILFHLTSIQTGMIVDRHRQ